MTTRPLAALILAVNFAGLVLAQEARAVGPDCVVDSAPGTVAKSQTIQAAVDDPSCFVINIASGTFAEHVTINRDVTIQGTGKDRTIVNGGSTGRVVTVANATVTLSGMAVQNGRTVQDDSLENDGGGIYNSGILTLTNVAIINNSTASGELSKEGGRGGGIFNSGTLRLINSRVSGNSTGVGGAEGGAGGNGGGIFNRGTLSVSNSIIDRNSAGSGSDGISRPGGAGGNGGGIYNVGVLTITNSTIRDNSTGFGGNYVSFAGERAGTGGSGGGIFNAGTLSVLSSTIAGNSTSAGGFTPPGQYSEDGSGGGILNAQSATARIVNTTVFGNTAYRGGGISNSGSVNLASSTIAGNKARFNGGNVETVAVLMMKNTIVANSVSGSNCSGDLVDGRGNLRWPQSDSSCVGVFGDPKLMPLADNGGPTLTLALGPGSAAINAGDALACAAANDDSNPGAGGLDQRGMPRRNGSCDSGAFEAQLLP